METALAPEPGAALAPPEAPLILCVEDDPILRDLMARQLAAGGYRVLSAHSLPAAFDLYRESRQEIALIISDFRLPTGTALDLVAHLQSLGPLPRILVCTGMLLPRAHDLLRAAGLTRYLFKPFRMPELLTAVRKHLAD